MGGNVRAGLEDSLWIGPGKLAESNAQQVTQVRRIVEGLGLTIATPDEAREILSLKGGDKVAFLGEGASAPLSPCTACESGTPPPRHAVPWPPGRRRSRG
jgi:beta-keto acid cleavage enzyme